MDPRCADAIFFNGDILTMDDKKRLARAIAVQDGVIVGVGSDSDVKKVAPRGCEKHDLGGRTIVPGFIDCHTHFVQMGVDSMSVDLSNTRSLEEALSLLKDAAKRISEGDWVIGTNWKESGWASPEFIDRDALDACCPRHPVVAHRVCGHMSSVSSLAISELGITAETPGAEVDVSRRLTGILKEGAVNIARTATAPDKAKRTKALAIAVRKAHSLGVTSIHDNGASEDFDLYRSAERADKLSVRVWFNTPAKNLDSMLRLSVSTGVGSGWLKLGGLKVFCDGALGARTAALSQEYSDDPGNSGSLVIGLRALDDIAMRANSAGIQLATHAIGDAGIETTIASLRRALEVVPNKDARHRIEHLELPSRKHLESMRKLRLIASMQPNFVGEWGGKDGMYTSRLGRERASRNNPFKEVLDNSIRLVFGSDCMPFSPLYGIHSAVNAPHASQRVSVQDSLAAYTRGASYASFEEGLKGTISEGKLADFAVLSDNPMTEASRISSIVVLKTVIGGEVVFERKKGGVKR